MKQVLWIGVPEIQISRAHSILRVAPSITQINQETVVLTDRLSMQQSVTLILKRLHRKVNLRSNRPRTRTFTKFKLRIGTHNQNFWRKLTINRNSCGLMWAKTTIRTILIKETARWDRRLSPYNQRNDQRKNRVSLLKLVWTQASWHLGN